MKRLVSILLLAATLSGCASVQLDLSREEPVALNAKQSLFNKLPELDGPPMTIAVYGFADKTGQMKPNDRLAVFSKAVTQGSEVFLIKALQDAKGWFKVVERVGLDNLIKERQLIRNQREVYEGKDAKPLKPMTVAGIMIEGGIIGYDSNIRSGGNGARFLGIGGSQQYRVDEVVISMRIVSVNSGEVLLTNAVSKTIYSTQHNIGVLRFVDAGTKALELENGAALNEPTTYAVRVAIEQAVYDMIVEGEKKGLWRYKKPKLIQPPVTQEELKKDEVIQPQTDQQPKGKEITISNPPVEQPVPVVEQQNQIEVPVVSKTDEPTSTKKEPKGEIVDYVNIRREKFRVSDPLAKLKPGIEVTVIEQERWFVRIRFNNIEGWIPSQFIKVHK
jgi:curli production assembly/transport component CsgG